MPSEEPKPKRCYDITVRVGADTWEDAARELERVALHVVDHGPECNQVSGGPDSGSWVHIDHNPEMTHDRYFEDVERFKDSRAYEQS